MDLRATFDVGLIHIARGRCYAFGWPGFRTHGTHALYAKPRRAVPPECAEPVSFTHLEEGTLVPVDGARGSSAIVP